LAGNDHSHDERDARHLFPQQASLHTVVGSDLFVEQRSFDHCLVDGRPLDDGVVDDRLIDDGMLDRVVRRIGRRERRHHHQPATTVPVFSVLSHFISAPRNSFTYDVNEIAHRTAP
jgi:hypothetical protein